MKVLLIIPAYNEEGNIRRVVENLRQNYPQYDYVVVNDGSTDATRQICRENGYSLLDLPVNLGLAGAFQTGMRYAWERGYDAAIQYDGDGQHDAGYIDAMLKAMEREHSGIVIGSRFVEERKPRSLRMLGSAMISFAIRLTTGKRITDPTSGMRAYSRDSISVFANNINFGPEPDTVSYLLRCGMPVSEVQVKMHERIAGASYLSLGRSIRYMIDMFLSILFIQFFRPRRTFQRV